MEINKKNKYEKTLIAVDSKNSIVKKEKKLFEKFEEKNNIYMVFPKKFKEVNTPDFSWALKSFFSTQK